MKNQKSMLLIIIALIVLLVSASALYNYFGSRIKPDTLSALDDGSADTDQDAAKPAKEMSEDTDSSQTAGNASEDDAADDEAAASDLSLAPDFTVTDMDGSEVSLSDFIGKPVILNFWASWCGPCKREMPDFDAAYATYQEDIHFLMVNLTDSTRETVSVASAFIEEQGYSFPVYYDTLGDALSTYQVFSIPATYFIDRDGNLVARAQGALDAETLQKGIDMIYSEE